MEKKLNVETYKPSHLSHELKENLKNRISRAKGHLESISKMIEEDRACEEIVLQLSAVKSALNETIVKLLEGHMEMCMNNQKDCGNFDAIELVKVLIRTLKSK
ncbi:MAG: metal-sensitive transcriptional regulator [Brevinematales bacterium]|nr:metal-sensitive transcriptional regulator [Brevinematales bacterium]